MAGLHVEVHGAEDAEPAVLVHGSFGWGLDTFPKQLALADAHRIVLVDRTGYGGTPPGPGAGWTVDGPRLVDLLAELGPAHLVGQSYGAVVALVAAGQRPHLVRSLVVIEPPLYRLADDDPAVTPVLAAARRLAEAAPALATREFVRQWVTEVMGRSAERADAWMATWGPQDHAAADTTRQEALASDAPIRYETLRQATWPKIVACGGWPGDLFPDSQRGGAALRSVASRLAACIDARLVEFERSAHNPQLEEPDAFNTLLREAWRSAG